MERSIPIRVHPWLPLRADHLSDRTVPVDTTI
jgi:hypothetical protein